jgi:hypothetical protein
MTGASQARWRGTSEKKMVGVCTGVKTQHIPQSSSRIFTCHLCGIFPSGCEALRASGVLKEDMDPCLRRSATSGEEVVVRPEAFFGQLLRQIGK